MLTCSIGNVILWHRRVFVNTFILEFILVKSSTYDKIFDNLITIGLYFAFCMAVYAVWTCSISAFTVFFYDMLWFVYWIYGAAAIPAIITSIVLISYHIATDRFKEIQYRDIWMAWATIVSYQMGDSRFEKCKKWIDENINGLHRIRRKKASYHGDRDTVSFIFKQKTDAVAFKLVWEEQSNDESA